MAKNEVKKGRSAKNGNKPAPYTKYRKRPYPYDAGYKQNCIMNGVCGRFNDKGVFMPLARVHAKEDAVQNKEAA